MPTCSRIPHQSFGGRGLEIIVQAWRYGCDRFDDIGEWYSWWDRVLEVNELPDSGQTDIIELGAISTHTG
jgi:hypothetical protein